MKILFVHFLKLFLFESLDIENLISQKLLQLGSRSFKLGQLIDYLVKIYEKVIIFF